MGKIKLYQQLEQSDCGIACIRMIAYYYGKKVPLHYLRELCDVGRLGVSLRGVKQCLLDIGFKTVVVKLGMSDVLQMPLPAILYWDQNHYVVLYRISSDGSHFYVADPARGMVKLRSNVFQKHWISSGNYGIALIVDPTDSFYERMYEKEDGWLKGLWCMAKRVVCDNRLTFTLVLFLSLIGIIADVVTPLLFQRTIDDGINGRDISLVWLLVGGQFVFLVGNYISNGIAEVLLTKAGLRMSICLMNEYLSKLIRLPISFFDRKINSDLIQKVNDENRIKSFLLSMPDTLLFTVVNLVIFSAMLIYYNFLIYCVFLIGTVLSYGWTILHLQYRRSVDYALFAHSSENQNNLYELVNGMPEIKVNNAQQARVAVWNKVQKLINKQSMNSAMVNLSINCGNTFFLRMKDIAITGLCATMVVIGKMTIGEMMTISYIVGRLTGPFTNIVGLRRNLQDVALSYERLDEIINGCDNNSFKKSIDVADAALSFDNVSFKYPGSYSPYVINNFTAIIEQGKTTAIVGPSGCGKTTLLKLMLGFYVPQKGCLKIGNMDVADVDNDEWLRYCGVVMQNGYVFSGTIIENIALSETNPDEDKVREAARLACIDDYFSSLPMGYHTRLGNAGLELSGGQKQRLFIARAVYKNPQFLFLDEATSSLDANNESAIVQNLARYNKGRTVVIAAHRLSTVRHADKIIYMDKGDLLEEGTHEELVARRGAYYRLVREQLNSN